MSQARLESFVETCANTAIGLVVALASQLVIFPKVGVHVSLGTNLEIVAWFTLISVVRGYVIRRWFNARIKAVAHKVAHLGEHRSSPQ